MGGAGLQEGHMGIPYVLNKMSEIARHLNLINACFCS